MRVFGLAGVIVVLGASALTADLANGATVPASPTAAQAGTTSTRHAYLKSFVCRRSLDPTKRAVSVTAVMRHITGTERLKLRFQLISSVPQAGPIDVRGANLGTWLSPDPITLGQNPDDVWIVRHPVTGVVVPATYRFKVSFRWVGSDHHTLRQLTRTSAACYEPDMRPDLLIKSITVNSVTGHPAIDRYVVVIGNSGLTTAKNLQVQFALSGSTAAGPPTQTIPKLYAHATHTLKFTASACSAKTTPTVTINGNGAVDDLDPTDNTLSVPCPVQSSSPARLH